MLTIRGQNEQRIEGQIRICTEYTENNGYTIVKVYKVYTDKARSGTNDHRPDFQKMISDALSGAFEQIMVYRFDHFARNHVDSIMYKEQLKKRYDIRVVFVIKPVNNDEGCEFCKMFSEWNNESTVNAFPSACTTDLTQALKMDRIATSRSFTDTNSLSPTSAEHLSKSSAEDEL